MGKNAVNTTKPPTYGHRRSDNHSPDGGGSPAAEKMSPATDPDRFEVSSPRDNTYVAPSVSVPLRTEGGKRLSVQEQLAHELKHSKSLDVRTESACYPTVWKRLAAAYKTAGLKGPTELMNNKGALIKDSVNTKEGRWYPSGNTDFRVLGSSDYSHPQWNKIPEKYRGEGMAGAMAQAGYADEPQNAWDGNLKPGAVLQMWNSESDYKGIKSGSGFNTNDIQSKVRGALGAVEDIGHSAVFVGYNKTLGVITGMVFVDHKGTQTLSRASPIYSVVRGANLRDKKEE